MFQRLAIDRGAILFDARRVDAAARELFDREAWLRKGALTERAGGRATVDFIDAGQRHWVMRRYRRGGLPARLASDRYLFLGENSTRSFRELRLLAALEQKGLPVPAPVAACYRRRLATYGAALITERLPGAKSLAEALTAGKMDDSRWAAVGRCLRRFHDAGVQHADLNAHNIMLGGRDEVWLLDFDRGRLRAPGPWRERALDRLARSLAKVAGDAKVVGERAHWESGFALLRVAHDA